jgi:hypothetical protein
MFREKKERDREIPTTREKVVVQVIFNYENGCF